MMEFFFYFYFKSILVLYGDIVEFMCGVWGFLCLNIMWYKDGIVFIDVSVIVILSN